jgi:hypothetical protein
MPWRKAAAPSTIAPIIMAFPRAPRELARVNDSQRTVHMKSPGQKGTEAKSVLFSAMMPMQGRPIQTECSAGVK